MPGLMPVAPWDLGSDVSAYTGASQAFFSEISGSSQHGVIVDGHLDAAVVFWAVAFVINLLVGLSGSFPRHRNFLSMGDAGDGRLCRRSFDSSPDPGHTEPGSAGSERAERSRVHVESGLSPAWETSRPGWQRPDRSSSACRSDLESFSITPPTFGRRMTSSFLG